MLAKLHAFLLLHGPDIHLCAELVMLIGLLTLPDGLTRVHQPGQARPPLLWCSELAAAYTGSVLLDAGPVPTFSVCVIHLAIVHKMDDLQSSVQKDSNDDWLFGVLDQRAKSMAWPFSSTEVTLLQTFTAYSCKLQALSASCSSSFCNLQVQ